MSQGSLLSLNVNKINFFSDNGLESRGSLSFGSEGLVITNNNDSSSNIIGLGTGATGQKGDIGATGQKGDIGATGPQGIQGPAGSGGGGGGTIYSGMTGVDTSNNQILFDLSSYFDSNTNIVSINCSISTTISSTTSEIYFYTSCFNNINGTGTKLTSTPELSIAKRNIASASAYNIVIPISFVIKNGVNFDATHKYLQIFVFATSGTTISTAKILNTTIPVSIFSI